LNVLKMAWRNVWRNSRRSSITITAMTLALVVELLYAGLVTGLVHGMEDDVTGMALGDIQIFVKGYLTKPSLYDAIDDPEAILEKLDKAGYPATARLYSGGLAASGESSAAVAFVGLDPQRDAKALSLAGAIARGQWLDSADPTGVVVGQGLARILGLELGSEVVVLSQAADGGMANALFSVRGILMSIAAGMDRGTVLMTEQAFRSLMVFPEGAHRIIVRRPVDVPLAEAKTVVQGIVGVPAALGDGAKAPREGEAGGINQVMTWKELSPFLAQWMASVSGVVVIIYLIVYIAVAILILNAMLMAVFERIREFGVLKAIGYGPLQVVSMMVLEGLFQAVVALVLGLIIATPFMWYLQTYGINLGVLGGVQMAGMTMPPIWYAQFALETALIPIVMLFVIVVGAVLYPAFKAGWISPVEAMHHQ